MEQSDILDDLANLEFCENEQKQLDEKFKPQTQVDINEPFYRASRNSSFVVQAISVILGFGACLEVSERFPDYKVIVFFAFVGLLVGWEYYKRRFLSEVQKIRIKNKYKKIKLKSTPYLIASAFLVSGSMAIGYYGAVPVIEKLSQHKELENIEDLEESYFLQIAEVQEEFLSASLANVIDSVKTGIFYTHGRKKGELKSSGASLFKELQKGESKNIEQKNEALIALRSEMNEEVKNAKDRNKVIVSEHKAWCKTFGKYSALGNIICDILLMILLRWCFNHEDSKRILNRKKKELKEAKEKEPFTIAGVKDKVKEQVKEVINQPVTPLQSVNPIAFNKRKEGDIIKGTGKKKDRILVEVNGELREYTKGKLKNLMKAQTGAERIKHLNNLIEKLG
jgi:hypothetical protein